MTIPPDTAFVPIKQNHYWPGGIPASVRFQPESEIPAEQLIEETNGWIFFLSENWVTREAAGVTGDFSDYETHQRRELIVRWAEAEQSFRDAYHERAPAPEQRRQLHVPANPVATIQNSEDWHLPMYSLIVLPRVDQTNPANHVQWIKQLLLLNRFDGVHENPLVGDDPPHHLILAGDSADAQSATTPANKEDVASWAYLENADFGTILMTRYGQAVYKGANSYHLMIDQSNLDEGTMSAVQYGHNGALKEEVRFRPFWIKGILRRLSQSDFFELDDVSFGCANMNGTVLEMLESAKESIEAVNPQHFASPDLADDVEHYAPGYVKLEAEGREAKYDEAPLIEAAFEDI